MAKKPCSQEEIEVELTVEDVYDMRSALFDSWHVQEERGHDALAKTRRDLFKRLEEVLEE